MPEITAEMSLRSYKSKKELNETEIEKAKTEIKHIEANIKVRKTNIEFCNWIIEKLEEHIAEKTVEVSK